MSLVARKLLGARSLVQTASVAHESRRGEEIQETSGLSATRWAAGSPTKRQQGASEALRFDVIADGQHGLI